MTTQRLNLVLPVGRYVTGDHLNKQQTDIDGRPIAPDDQSFDFGVAVRKDAPGLNELFQQIWNYTYAAFQRDQNTLQRMGRGIGVGTKQGGISWKIKDGDQPNAKGETPEASRGCWIFFFSSKYPVKCANNQNIEIDPSQIKRGYYVDVAFSVAPNGQVGDRAGIYLNHQHMRLQGYGEEIRGGMTAEQAFGAAPAAYAPPGMSQTPVAGAMPAQMPTPQQPYQQAPGNYPPQMPPQQPGNFTPPPPAATMPPATGTVPMQPPPPYAPQPAAPAPAYPSSQPGNYPPQAGYPPQSQTQYPINPATGQPVAPHPNFLTPPR